MKRYLFRPLNRVIAVVLVGLVAATIASAHSNGITGSSGKSGSDCTSCHSQGTPKPAVAINGPASVTSGSTVTYTLTNDGIPVGGLDVAATDGTFAAGAGTKVLSGEITQTGGLNTSPLSWTFSWTAPAGTTSVTMFAASISNGKGGSTGTTTKTITVQPLATSGAGFQVSTPATVTAHVGQPVTLPVTITPSGGFSGQVALSLSGLPTGVTAAFSANPVTVLGTAMVNATFTVNSAVARSSPTRRQGVNPLLPLSLSFVGTVIGTMTLRNGKNAKRRGFWLLLAAILLISLVTVACGSGAKSTTSTGSTPSAAPATGTPAAGTPAAGTPAAAPQTFTVTVTGTSGTLQQSSSVLVTVN